MWRNFIVIIINMLSPPEPAIEPTIEQLIEAVNTYAREEGYAVVKRRSNLSTLFAVCVQFATLSSDMDDLLR